MALGSSAPEILLAVVEQCGRLGKPAGELGPSTIVGSASFNLLFISAICIPCIADEKDEETGEMKPGIRKIDDLGVFIVTSIFSLFAYLWVYICIMGWTPGIITTTEAFLTLGFFVLLLIMAFGADKYR